MKRKIHGHTTATSLQRGADSPLVVHLALQGGGAHGAFTWGVLDCLLDEPTVEIASISGSSAGALNGAALVCGYRQGGRAGAKSNLARLWRNASEAGSLMAALHLPLRKPWMGVWDDALPVMSPYQVAPLGLEPLRHLVSSIADFREMPDAQAPRLYVNAVNVHTGRTRVFGPDDMSVSAVMASACAPLMFPAMVIDGESYWDGSYGANPSLSPLYEKMQDVDILLVKLNQDRRVETPLTAKNILNRLNEIASVNGMHHELANIARLNAGGAAIRLHTVSLAETLTELEGEPSSKRTVDPLLFRALRESGHQACSAWLGHRRNPPSVSPA